MYIQSEKVIDNQVLTGDSLAVFKKFVRLVRNIKNGNCRQFIFLLITFLFCNYSFAQIDQCQIGTDSAKADYKKGILRVYLFGRVSSSTTGKILMDEYGVEAIDRGCIADQKSICYSEFMKEKIKDKFGRDIFEKVEDNVSQVDNMGDGDRKAIFLGG